MPLDAMRLKPGGKQGPLYEGQVLALEVFLALGNDQILIGKIAHDRFHRAAKRLQGGKATMAIGDLIAIIVLRAAA